MDTAGKLDSRTACKMIAQKQTLLTEMTTKWLVMDVHKIALLKFINLFPLNG